jgi:hypothetical protein
MLALLAALAVVGWRWLFPSPEQVIRKQLKSLAAAASFSANEAPLSKLANSRHLASFFSTDVEADVDLPGHSRIKFNGREELLQAALLARSGVGAGGVTIEFLDILVTLGADRSSAEAELTAEGRVGGEPDLVVQELKLQFKNIQGDWLITRVETLKTLSRP